MFKKTFIYVSAVIAFQLAVVMISFIPGIRGTDLHESLMQSDQASYVNNAAALLDKMSFTRDMAPPFLWEPYRTPGLPLLICVVMFFHGSLLWIPVVNAFFAGIAAYYGIRMIRLFTSGNTIVFYYCLLLAVLPNLLGTTCYVLTEPSFCAFTVAWLFYFVRYLREERVKDILLSSAALACAQLIKPTLSAAPLLIAVILLIHHLPAFRKIFTVKNFLLLAMSLPAVLFMSYKNASSHGVFKPSLLGEETKREYLSANYFSDKTGRDYYEIQEEIRRNDKNDALLSASPGQSYYGTLYNIKKQKNDSLTAADPAGLGKVFMYECVREVFAPQEAVFMTFSHTPSRLLRGVGFLLNLCFYAQLLIGCVVLFRRRLHRYIFIIVLFYGFFIAAGAMSSRQGGRFRLPADIIALPAAAAGLALLLHRKKIDFFSEIE